MPLTSTSYGEPAGLFGINCGHSPPNVFTPGLSVIRGQAPNEQENARLYKLQQEQRQKERSVRYAKRDAAIANASGDKEMFDKYALEVKRRETALNDFIKANKLSKFNDRTQVFGYNRSVASKATQSIIRSEMFRRKVASDGHEIIDTPTYSRLVRSFKRNSGIIIRGEEAARHLEKQFATASYVVGGNLAFIKDDATVSDVLEEMFHAKQDRKNTYSDLSFAEMVIRREIDAQKYLLSVAEKYNIPSSEIEVTKTNLSNYMKDLEGLK